MYLKNFNLKNKTALVTGAGKGIGKACAIALAQAGANLIIISRTKKDLLGVQKKIISYKRKCTFFECDLFDIEKLDTVFKKIRKIDINRVFNHIWLAFDRKFEFSMKFYIY